MPGAAVIRHHATGQPQAGIWSLASRIVFKGFGVLHPRIYKHYLSLAEKYQMKGPFLEIGASPGPNSILAGAYFQGKPGRVSINLGDREMSDDGSGHKIEFVRANSNDMRNEFADNSFGTVLSNAVIEHDKYFWRSIEEIKRVLTPGGIMAIGAPGYIAQKHLKKVVLAENLDHATVTYNVHVQPDYWRFSVKAFKDVICEGMEILEIQALMRVPIIVAVAKKPLPGEVPPPRVKAFRRKAAAA